MVSYVREGLLGHLGQLTKLAHEYGDRAIAMRNALPSETSSTEIETWVDLAIRRIRSWTCVFKHNAAASQQE